jgi:hypothetical protein
MVVLVVAIANLMIKKKVAPVVLLKAIFMKLSCKNLTVLKNRV